MVRWQAVVSGGGGGGGGGGLGAQWRRWRGRAACHAIARIHAEGAHTACSIRCNGISYRPYESVVAVTESTVEVANPSRPFTPTSSRSSTGSGAVVSVASRWVAVRKMRGVERGDERGVDATEGVPVEGVSADVGVALHTRSCVRFKCAPCGGASSSPSTLSTRLAKLVRPGSVAERRSPIAFLHAYASGASSAAALMLMQRRHSAAPHKAHVLPRTCDAVCGAHAVATTAAASIVKYT